MDLNQYLDLFIEESKEHLQTINTQLLLLEKEPSNLSIVNEIFRSAHTMKGMSGTMGFTDLANLTHKMENVLDGIRNNHIAVTSRVLDAIFSAIDDLEVMVESIASGGDGKRDVSAVVKELQDIESGRGEAPVNEQTESEPESSANKVDSYTRTIISQAKEQGLHVYHIVVNLREDCVLKRARVFMVFEVLEKIGEIIRTVPNSEALEEEDFQSEFEILFTTKEETDLVKEGILKISEIVDVKIGEYEVPPEAVEKDNEAPNVAEKKKETKPQEVNTKEKPTEEKAPQKSGASSNKTIRVNIDRLDILMNLFEELVIDRGRLEQIAKDLSHTELKETVERMTRVSSDLQSIILNIRMIPIETVFNRFPRMVRQLAKDLGKKVEFVVMGAETELDRTVIDEIGDPLVHLIRNAIDHGIETPEVRRSKGKSEIGTIELKAYHSGNHVFIEISEDGAGISKERVIQKAISKGIISQSTASTLNENQIYDLIFSSGFSTAEKISDVSGRGVGLDVVKNTIESLGGAVMVTSKENQGSLFSIQLPLTLSIISVLLIQLEEEKYAIPLSSIIETASIKNSEIMTVQGQKVIDFRGKIIPLLSLKSVFQLDDSLFEKENCSVVIVRKGGNVLGLIVDSFIGQQEIVLKGLGEYLNSVFAISGATILGDGQVALIVDCNALIK